MLPTVTQQLQSMKLRMEETIIPELPASAKFAREQAAFILIQLKWLLDTHAHEYRYEVVENAEYRRLLAAMLDRAGALPDGRDTLAQIARALGEPGPAPQEAVIPVAELTEQNRRLKHLAAELYSLLSARGGPAANPARDLMQAVAIAQGDRELSFFRRTGYIGECGELGPLLGERARAGA